MIFHDLPIFQFLVPFEWDILPLRVDVGLFWGLLILLGKVGKVSNKGLVEDHSLESLVCPPNHSI